MADAWVEDMWRLLLRGRWGRHSRMPALFHIHAATINALRLPGTTMAGSSVLLRILAVGHWLELRVDSLGRDLEVLEERGTQPAFDPHIRAVVPVPVSYTHLRAHETPEH